jgi:phenylalanyl-tRNA synthetase beta subunit
VERDVCFQVSVDEPYQSIFDATKAALAKIAMETTITPVDIYQAEGASTKNITLRLGLTSHEKTLTGDEISAAVNSVTEAVVSKTGAVVV